MEHQRLGVALVALGGRGWVVLCALGYCVGMGDGFNLVKKGEGPTVGMSLLNGSSIGESGLLRCPF